MDYTICEKVLEDAKNNIRYVSKLLMPFTDDSKPIRVVKNSIILDKYNCIAKDNNYIYSWIDMMGKLGQWKELECEEENNIYIETCKKSYDRKLIVCEKDDYDRDQYKELSVYNKDEAISEINSEKGSMVIFGDNNVVSMGSDSPNVIGNFNKIENNKDEK